MLVLMLLQTVIEVINFCS